MNDFERKLSQQPFREPPPELRESIFAEAGNIIVPPSWTWRDWFWPSPEAWAALAAVWVFFAVLNAWDSTESDRPLPLAQTSSETVTLLTLHSHRDYSHALNLAN